MRRRAEKRKSFGRLTRQKRRGPVRFPLAPARGFLVFSVRSSLVAEGLGDAAVGRPDLLGEVGELLQVRLAEADLLLPAVDVDREQLVEVGRVDLKAVGVELVLGRQDADRALNPFTVPSGNCISHSRARRLSR